MRLHYSSRVSAITLTLLCFWAIDQQVATAFALPPDQGSCRSVRSSVANHKKKNGCRVGVATGVPPDFYPYGEWKKNNNNDEPNNNRFYVSSETLRGKLQQQQQLQKRGGAKTNLKTNDGASSVASTTFNVMKAMLGSGVLALASGLAAVSDQKSMIIPANILFLVLGALSAYTFALYGRLCHATGAKSLGEIWKRVYDTNDSTPISLASFSFCYGSCLIFLLIIGDTMNSLVKAAMASSSSKTLSSLAGLLASRQTAILSIAATMLWPLCNLKSLAALAPFSIIGVVASIVSSAFVALRCPSLFPSSPYNPLYAAQNFLASLPAHQAPLFGTYSHLRSPAPLVLMGMGGMALMAHFSAPDFYQSLASNAETTVDVKDETKPKDNSALKKYLRVTTMGYPAVGLVNALTMTCGFLTFGGNSAGMILNNYATRDIGAAVSRLLVAVSMIGGYPLMHMALKSATADLFQPNQAKAVKVNGSSGTMAAEKKEQKVSAMLFASLLAIAMFVKDAGFVVGLNGAVMGSAIIYTFPSLMFLKATMSGKIKGSRADRLLCKGLFAFGIVASILGGATTVLNTYFPHLMK